MIDDGDLHLSIVDENKCCYRLDGDELKDSQTLLQKSCYQVCVIADNYHQVVSLNYNMTLNN